MILKDLVNLLEKEFPKELKEDWDNIGLLVGENKSEIKKIQISLDLTKGVLENAVENNVDMIITHHPLIFKPLNAITNESLIGQKILKLIKNNISLYCLHTNLDSKIGGLNDLLLKKIGVKKSFIINEKIRDICKLSIYIPTENFEKIRDEILRINSFETNDYRECSYSSEYEETYTPVNNSTPRQGFLNNRSFNSVKKMEIIIDKKRKNFILSEIKKIHSYEEPAYEIIEIKNEFVNGGIGRVFKLEEEEMLSNYIKKIKIKLNIDNVRAVFNKDRKIKKIAVVNGSGSSFLKIAKKFNIDLFITGDVKYHEALDSLEDGVAVLDIGHYESEVFFSELILEVLNKKVDNINVYNEDPVFKFL